MSRRIDENRMTLIGEHGELTVETKIKGDVAEMKLNGCMYMDIEQDLFDEVSALLSAGKHVVMNCKALESFSSTACEKLLKSYFGAAEPAKRRLEVCCATGKVLEQLQDADVDYVINSVRTGE